MVALRKIASFFIWSLLTPMMSTPSSSRTGVGFLKYWYKDFSVIHLLNYLGNLELTFLEIHPNRWGSWPGTRTTIPSRWNRWTWTYFTQSTWAHNWHRVKKFLYNFCCNDATMSQLGTCHTSWAVVAYICKLFTWSDHYFERKNKVFLQALD